MVTRFDNDYYEKAKIWYVSFVGKKLYKLRKTVMEGLFGEAKTYHGLSRAKLRGIDNVEIQLLLTATVLNIKRLFKKLDAETLRNAAQKLQDQFQYLVFSIFHRYLARLLVCWV